MKRKVVVASNNQHKIKEIKQILNKFNMEVISLKEAKINVEVEEDGKTFMENAFKKAYTIHKIIPECMIIADDSGLMVDKLNGAPGIYSARFSGEHGNDEKNNEKLLEMLQGTKMEDRTGKFVSAVVFIIDEDNIIKVQGEISGLILNEKKGTNGFGYDPLFYIPEYKKSFAEMNSELKNKISHRANSLKMLNEKLCDLYNK